MKKVLFVAQDAAPSQAFRRFARALTEAGFETRLIVANGESFPATHEEIDNAVKESQLVIIGMSSDRKYAGDELFAAEQARRAEIPYGFYADVEGCDERVEFWPKGISVGTSLYLTQETEDTPSQRIRFPRSIRTRVGNPLHEEMALVRFSREEVRSKLCVKDGDRLVLIAGGKSTYSNIGRIQKVLNALSSGYVTEFLSPNFNVVMSLHKGDKAPYAMDISGKEPQPLGIYDEIIQKSPVPFSIIRSDDDFNTGDMMAGADLVICGLTGSSAVQASYKRRPVIQIRDIIDLGKLRKETGLDKPDTVSKGAALMAEDITDLAMKISNMLTWHGNQMLVAKQEEHYPQPEEVGTSVRRVVEAVRAILQEVKKSSEVEA